MTDLIESQAQSLSQPIQSESIHVVYSWKLGKQMYLSKARKLIVDTYLETRNYQTCREVLLRECKREISVPTIKRWLELPDVRAYVFEQFEEKGIYEGWTKEHWFKVMTDHLRASAEWEQAKEDLKMYEGALGRSGKDADAQIGLAEARGRMLEAGKKRLATGDLYAMKLIGQFKGWETQPVHNNLTQINITQKNGKE